MIEPSTASYYSQVILASKPIPKIGQLFGRLGTHHSNLFGVMDLTVSYHQAPVSLGTRVFLAFAEYFSSVDYLLDKNELHHTSNR
jgi:hypothetical protein